MSRFHSKPVQFVNQLVLKVEDIERSKDFYTRIMGLSILKENEKSFILTPDGKSPIIKIIQPQDVIPKEIRRAGLYHFAILLPSSFQLGLFLKHLRANNYPIRGGSNHGVSNAVYLNDPDGIQIEIYTDTDTDLWLGNDDRINMVTNPLDYDKLINETGDEKWLGAPKETILGHIHLHIGDLDEAARFYIHGLGFQEVTKMSNSALFISDGGYHHHIGLNIWNGKNAPPTSENAVGMVYFTIKLADNDRRNNIIERLRSLGYAVKEEEEGIFTKDNSNNLIKLDI